MKTYEVLRSDFKKYFKYTDAEILKKGKCIDREYDVKKDIRNILNKVQERDKLIHRIVQRVEKKSVYKAQMDNYIFYIKNKWVNMNDENGPPAEDKLFNVKFQDFCHFYREIIPKHKTVYKKK